MCLIFFGLCAHLRFNALSLGGFRHCPSMRLSF
ncbi:hypothetical protein PSYAR_15187 [Pseudomonas syringae pv. aceris str. M302273]|nr:hypothetical protein PSYAR_15187 [Pseudomonas syringae pv. aceris str. M302273]